MTTTSKDIADTYLGSARMRMRKAADPAATAMDKALSFELAAQHYEALAAFIEETGVLPTAWQKVVNRG